MFQGKTKNILEIEIVPKQIKIFFLKYYLNKIKCDNMASSRTCYE